MFLKKKGTHLCWGLWLGCQQSDNSNGLDKELSESGTFMKWRKHQYRSEETASYHRGQEDPNPIVSPGGNPKDGSKIHLFPPTHHSGLR